MRSRVAVLGMVVAVGAAAAAVGLALAAATWSPADAVRPEATASPTSASAEPVTEIDFCYVESMIFYRVETGDLGDALLDASGTSGEARTFATELVAEQAAELDELRPWYVSWSDAKPLEPAEEGPCAGHGDHTVMPGMPSWAQWRDLVDADGAEAELLFADLLIAQHTAMIELVSQILAEDAHPRVHESAATTLTAAERELTALHEIRDRLR